MSVAVERACVNCGRTWGGGRCCQFCAQVEGLPSGVRLSSASKRLGALLLETVLVLVTLGIGWLVWALIVFKNGQTPAKQLLGMRLVGVEEGVPSSWGRTFIREFIIKTGINVLIGWAFIPYFWLLWDKDRQQLWDKISGTIVVDDPNRQLP
ncbi:MAG: RDD family protein [Chloroflexota bacterium]